MLSSEIRYAGLRVIVDDNLAFNLVQRTWTARLFSLPWRPWIAKEKVRKSGPPPYYVDQKKGVVYTTSKGYDDLKKVTQRRDYDDEVRGY